MINNVKTTHKINVGRVAAYKGIIEAQHIHNTIAVYSVNMNTIIINAQLATINTSVLI